jgi:hypothetical protein
MQNKKNEKITNKKKELFWSMQSITGIGVKSLADLRIATPLITFLFILKFKHFFFFCFGF